MNNPCNIRNITTILFMVLLFHPLQASSQGSWATAESLLFERGGHSATLLQNGRVLVAGGGNGVGGLNSAEIYDSQVGTWTSTGAMEHVRGGHTATLLRDGKVLVAGGDWSDLRSCELYDPATGTWAAAAAMAQPRTEASAVLMPDGRVLVSGGNGDGAGDAPTTAEIYWPDADSWLPAGTTVERQRDHTMVLLRDGRVLAHGWTNNSPEIYDPLTTGTWVAAATSPTSREDHTATLLADGKVMIAGGTGDPGTSVEIYDPNKDTWTEPSSSLQQHRERHTATLLADGALLVVGGGDVTGTPLASTEVYDPGTATWTSGPPLASPRQQHTATALADGRVLVVGGMLTHPDYLSSVEIYVPKASGSWSEPAVAELIEARVSHRATILPNSQVLVVSGGGIAGLDLSSAELFDPVGDSVTTTGGLANFAPADLSVTLLPDGKVLAGNEALAELYNPVTGAWSPTGFMLNPRHYFTLTPLPDGRVLAGPGAGMPAAEIYDPSTNLWTVAGSPTTDRQEYTATLLADGRVLVAGGQRAGGEILASAELYDPLTDSWTTKSSMRLARFGHSATLLGDGRVLVTAGRNTVSGASLRSVELYDPATGSWFLASGPNQSLHSPRDHHTATRLPDGRVVVAGGEVPGNTVATVEVYEPHSKTWEERVLPGQVLNTSRSRHTATLLHDGRIMVAGGLEIVESMDTILSSVELFSLYPDPDPRGPRRPVITSAVVGGSIVTVTGTGFGGDSEASGGSRAGSPSNSPSLVLRAVENGHTFVLAPDSLPDFCALDIDGRRPGFCSGESATLSFSALPAELNRAMYDLTIVSSGVASTPTMVAIPCLVPSVAQHPQDVTVSPGTPSTFSAAGTTTRWYQWQYCDTGGCADDGDWVSIPGATGSSFTTAPVAAIESGRKLRVEALGSCFNPSVGCSDQSVACAASDAATITVADPEAPMVEIEAPTGGEYWLLSDIGQPANEELVTWSMSDNVRICQVSASLICSQNGVDWIDVTSGNGLPFSDGSAGACVSPGINTSSAGYEVPTVAPAECGPGALYKAQVMVTDHAGNAATTTSAGAFYIVQPNPDSVSTLILHNLGRMQTKMGLTTTQTVSLETKLFELADNPLVEGWVVDLGDVSTISDWYTAWDASGLAPTGGNDVLFGAAGVHDYLVNDLLAAFPNVENVVVVGDDRIIPFARITDEAALLLESVYTVSGTDLTATGTSVGQAIAAGYYLSDDPLVVKDSVTVAELDETLFTADLAVGRLVEQPDEIIGTIATFISQGGGLDLTSRDPVNEHWALVTGYDFLIDSANTVAEKWKNLLSASITDTASFAPVDASLVSSDFGLPGSSGFDADDRAAALLQHIQGGHDDPPGGFYGVMNLNGHATHYETGVPGTGTFDIKGLDTSAMTGTDLSGSVAYGVGCHAGLVVAGSTDPNDHPQDLPQTLLANGVVAYVANTGYGWGLINGIGYGERLVQLLTEELTAGGSVAIGEAVRRAKLRYVLESPAFDQYDVKSLHQWTLYGLPMYTVRVSNGARTARPFSGTAQDPENLPARQQLGEVVVDQRISGGGAGDRALPDYLTQLSLSFNLSAAGVYTKKTAAGLTTTESGCPDPDGCYYQLNGLVQRSSGSSDLPLQPYLIFDSRLSGTSQHGVLWMGGTYDEETGWVPVIADLVSNAGTDGDHGAAPKHSLGSPSSLGNLDGPSPDDCRLVDYETSSLVVITGEAVDASGLLLWDVERTFNSIDLEALYYNNSSDSTFNCDRTGPEFGAEPFVDGYHELVGSALSFQVPVTDLDAAVWRVVIVYNDEAQDAWLPLELTEDAGSWIGTLELLGTEVTTYMIQAVDARGNVDYVPYVPTSLPTSGVDIDLPDTVDLPYIFGDGFESGDTILWSTTQP